MREREYYINKGGLLGIGANLLLFIVKFLVGFFTGSISVTADSFNNLSDMGSSVVSMIGLKLAGRPSDAEHPFGHGRIEYISGAVVAVIILLLGIELARDAFFKILHPAPMRFGIVPLVLLCLTVPVKLGLAAYNRRVGKMVQSPTMLAAAKDSLNDVLVTAATIVSAIVSLFSPLPLDGYIGVGVAVFVILSGVGILKDTLGPLLGQAPPKEMANEIAERILSFEGIRGIHDLILHNYGPEKYIGSVHAEVRADGDLLKIHDVIDNAERQIREEMGVLLCIHMDPVETDDALTCELKEKMQEIIAEIDPALTLHDFRIVSGDTHTNLIFDVVLPPKCRMKEKVIQAEIDKALATMHKTYFTVITFERSFV
ncbi:MAG: cation diffusion facilitator family transporter [Clostridia bacterium]|nr:cation diffusion facilitator family transporter [Clostridia bacterium]